MAYQELRQRALNLNQQEAWKHPCSEGNGACCEPNIFITNNDALHIRQAVSQRRIPLNVVQDAKRRLRIKDRQRCAFLGEDNLCTIYEDRPLICILAGAGARTRRANTIKAVEKFKTTGEDTAIPCQDASNSSCEDCFKVMEQTGFTFNASSIAEYEEISNQNLAGGRGKGLGIVDMNKFIKDLPSGR